jgi:alpha-beta hydrolase superfamily lysophospholipase
VTLVALTACAGTPAPPAPVVPVVPVASCVDEDEQRTSGVRLKRADGQTVDGLVLGSGSAAVILANQSDGDLCQWKSHAQILAQQGYLAIVFNYSPWSGAENDVLAAVTTARERGATDVFLLGASRGGTAVLAAAAQAQPPVNAVVSLSAPQAHRGTSAALAMPTFTTPVLFMVGETDAPFAEETRKLYEACAAADKRLEVFNNGRHGIALVDANTFDLIRTFIAKHGPG